MIVDWPAFVSVVAGALIAACLLVTLFSLGLRLGDGSAPWRRPVSVGLFVVCAAVVAVGIYLIVPFFTD